MKQSNESARDGGDLRGIGTDAEEPAVPASEHENRGRKRSCWVATVDVMYVCFVTGDEIKSGGGGHDVGSDICEAVDDDGSHDGEGRSS